MRVRRYSSFDDLPQNVCSLFAEVGRESFYLSLPWFRNLAATTSDPGDQLAIYAVDVGDGEEDAKLAFVMRARSERQAGMTLRTLAGFSNVYSMIYAPVMRPGDRAADAAIEAWARWVATERPSWDSVYVWSLDPQALHFPQIEAALRKAGFVVGRHFHFGNWYEPVEGVAYRDYVASLAGNMRSLLKNQERRLQRAHKVRYTLFRGGDDLASARADYQHVYDRSWKQPEPYPEFIPGLIRAGAETGTLRMGVLYVDEVPAAAQIWIYNGPGVTIYKVAYDEAFKRSSVGSLVTGRIMDSVLAEGIVREVDFGYGDDPYKKDWLRQRRERWAIESYNPRTPKGALTILTRLGRRAAKNWLNQLMRRD